MLKWIVWNRTDYLHKNRFGIKLPTKGWYAIKPGHAFKYCYLMIIILLNVNHFFAHRWFQVLLSQCNWPSATTFLNL